MSCRHPRTVVDVTPSNAFKMEFPELHERKADLVFAILQKSVEQTLGEELKLETLFEDRICLATGRDSRWSGRRKVDFGDLTDALWIMPPSGAPGEAAVLEAFRTRGLPPPRVSVKTLSVQLRNALSKTGRFIAVLPASTLQIELAMPPQFVVIGTLKNRTLSPVVERFIECAREVAVSFVRSQKRKA
jgi:DNA-binding transcriptional LysR family regulator